MFTGFTPESIDFLWGIRLNNNREWFLDHKKQYQDTLYEPMKALGQDLFEPFLQRSGDLLKVSRIYRDTRLHPPVPYKESLWICIRKDVDFWSEHPCLCFELSPERAQYGFLLWSPKAAAMEQFRKAIAAEPRDFLTLLEKTEKETGIPLTAACYKRPKPADDPALAPYFAWKNHICCLKEEPVSEALFGPALGQRVGALLRQLTPLYDYFYHIIG